MRRKKSIVSLGGALLLLAILAAYANHFHNTFHRDDEHTIITNTYIRDLRNIPLFFHDGTTFSAFPTNQSYRPLVSTLLAIDYHLGHGLEPFWFHLSIFVLFVALVLLLGFVIYRLLESDPASAPNGWIALVAAGWYALDPANADTINYIIACSDVISALGVIGSFAVYFAFPQGRRYCLYVLPAAVAILAKPTTAIFAVLFAVYRLLFREPAAGQRRLSARMWLAEVVPGFVICGALLLFIWHMTPPSWISGAANAPDYLVTQPYVALLYFKMFFWPAGLSAVYDLTPFVTIADPRLWIGFAFAFLISGAAIVAAVYEKTRAIGFGLLWFLIALLPTSLFPLVEVMNDHRTFLAYMGLVIAIAGAASNAFGVARMSRPQRWTKIVGTGVVALFLCANAYATFYRNKAWRTEETFWRNVVLKSPNNGIGLTAYGMVLVNNGDFDGAFNYFHRAQKVAPRYSELLIDLAIAESLTKQDAAAEQHFQDALRLAPWAPGTYTNYARYLLQHSRVDEARALLSKALALNPNDLYARQLSKEAEMGDLGLFTLARTASLKEAETTARDFGLFGFARDAFLKEAQTKARGFGLLAAAYPPIVQALNPLVRQAPEFYLAVSVQFYRQERYIESIFASRLALDVRPGYAEAWNNIGAAYNKLGCYQEAATASEQALRYKPDFVFARINLQYARLESKKSGR